MKTLFGAAFVFLLAAMCSGADLKIGTVDYQKVMTDYYKAREILKSLEQQQARFLKELDLLRSEGGKLTLEAETLRDQAFDAALSPAGREAKVKDFRSKLADLNAFRIKYDQARADRESQWRAQFVRANQVLQDDILSVMRRIAEREGFNLVLNASKENPLSGPVLFSNHVDDLTGKVLASLNAAQPSQPEAESGKK